MYKKLPSGMCVLLFPDVDKNKSLNISAESFNLD